MKATVAILASALLAVLSSADDVEVEWATGLIINPITVSNGDRIIFFTLQDTQDDVILFNNFDDFGNCNVAGGDFVVLDDSVEDLGEGRFGFVVTVQSLQNGFPDVGVPFGLSTSFGGGASCLAGQKIEVTIDTDAPTDAPTQAPSTAPSFSPSTAPSVAPSNSPTVSPTQSPIVTINTPILWTLPQNALRFSQKAFATEQEIIEFTVIGNHNLLQFPDKEAFDECNFDEAEVISIGGTREEVTVDPGESKYFGCNRTNGQGDVHCDLGQKIEITGIDRQDDLTIAWFRPENDADRALFETERFVKKGSNIRFNIILGVHDVVQFLSKEAFDACDFSAGNVIQSRLGVSSNVLYRDLFANDEDDANDILWFGCSVGDHCSVGQKVALQVVEDDFIPDDDNDNDNDDGNGDGNNLLVPILGAVAGIAIVVLLLVLVFRRRSSTSSRYVVEAKSPVIDEEVVKTPYSHALSSQKEMKADPEVQDDDETPQNPSVSLARSKAALSGLNF